MNNRTVGRGAWDAPLRAAVESLRRIAAVLLFLGTLALSAEEASPAPRTRSVGPRPAAGPRILPSAHGDWTQWRGNPQHTGFQSLAGRIERPQIQWKHRLGGKLEARQAVLCSGLAGAVDEGLLVAPPGRLAAYSLDGDFLWEKRQALDLQLMGCWDFWGDSRRQILAGSNGSSGGMLYLFDAKNGDLLWESEPGPGQVGAVKVIRGSSSAGRELLWLPAASSILSAYAFPAGSPSPSLHWQTVLDDFVSDPYSFSSLALATLSDGREAVVIGGARHQIPSITVDAKTGREISRTSFTFDGHAVESGGWGQLLDVRDLDGTGPQIINVSSYGSNSSYMFQGITVNDPADPERKRVLDSYPFGLHYVRGSIDDFDGDGRADILVSRFNPDTNRHDLLLLDASSLRVKATLPDFWLSAIVPGVAGQGAQILGSRGIASEVPSGGSTLVGFRYEAGAFRQTPFQPAALQIATVLTRAFDQPSQDNPGAAAEVLDVNGDAIGEILGFRDVDRDGKPDELVVVHPTTGDFVSRYDGAPGVGLALLAVHRDAAVSKSRVVLGADDGNLIFLDGGLGSIREVSVGGYYRNSALNGHSFEVAVVANLDGRGNAISVVDSRNRVLELVGRGATPDGPSERILWNTGVRQELVALPRSGAPSHLLVRGYERDKPFLAAIDGSGNLFWQHLFAGPNGSPPEDSLPIGMNYGFFHDSESPDVIVSMTGAGALPRRTCALDGVSGRSLWCSDTGTFWDATMAVWDFDGDGRDDVVMNFSSSKGAVISGNSGKPLMAPVELPEYQDLEVVDYNGAPMIAGFDEQGAVEVVNAEDDAHLTLLSIQAHSGKPTCCQTFETWNQPQSAPDDQRFSMAALAPMGEADWIVGVGGQAGSVEARRGRDGFLLWTAQLWSGSVVSADGAPRNALSSVAAVDVDGDGRVEFLIGGFDGWLYALDAETGRLRWSLDLGAPAGDPIAADLDGDGFSELLVPVADGYIYAVGRRAEPDQLSAISSTGSSR